MSPIFGISLAKALFRVLLHPRLKSRGNRYKLLNNNEPKNNPLPLPLPLPYSLYLPTAERGRNAAHIYRGGENRPGEKAIITGKIINLDVYPHVKKLEIKLLDFYGNETTHTSPPLTEDGMFRFEIYPITTREISFVPVEDRIVIAPGDSLYIEKDFRNISHTVFGGHYCRTEQAYQRLPKSIFGTILPTL